MKTIYFILVTLYSFSSYANTYNCKNISSSCLENCTAKLKFKKGKYFRDHLRIGKLALSRETELVESPFTSIEKNEYVNPYSNITNEELREAQDGLFLEFKKSTLRTQTTMSISANILSDDEKIYAYDRFQKVSFFDVPIVTNYWVCLKQ